MYEIINGKVYETRQQEVNLDALRGDLETLVNRKRSHKERISAIDARITEIKATMADIKTSTGIDAMTTPDDATVN